METEQLAIEYGYKAKPSALLNTIFTWTVNTAAKTLLSVASNSKTGHTEKWKPTDHLKFMGFDGSFPSSLAPSPYYLLGVSSPIGLLDLMPSSSSLSPSLSSSLDLVLYEGSDEPSIKALGRALSHHYICLSCICLVCIGSDFTLLNEIPATSRKYQFAVAMADRIVDENSRDGHVELLHINRTILASAFAYNRSSLSFTPKTRSSRDDRIAWPSRIIKALPLGSYLTFYVKGLSHCVSTIFPSLGTSQSEKKQQLAMGGGEEEIMAEKLAQELLWIMDKLRGSCLRPGLLSLTANPRVQGSIVKISAILVEELSRVGFEVPRQVKFRLIGLWLPLFCFAGNGLAFPFLTGYEKAETERALDRVISTLPATDQEVILTNWLQDFTISASDWPNLQVSYDRWCLYIGDYKVKGSHYKGNDIHGMLVYGMLAALSIILRCLFSSSMRIASTDNQLVF
ncbi:hypothetical protein AAG906_008070 [Vitis piasezkii]